MSADFQNTPVESSSAPTDALPEHFPAVSVDLTLREELKKQGRTIEVDFDNLNQTLVAAGVPETSLDEVDVEYNKPANRLFTHGSQSEYLDGDSKLRQVIEIPITPNLIKGATAGEIHTLTAHESVHVADALANIATLREAGMTDEEIIDRNDHEFVQRTRLERLGKTAIGFALAWATAKASGAGMPSPEDIHYAGDLIFVDGPLVLAGVAGYATAMYPTYKMRGHEKHAYAEQATVAGQSANALSFPPTA